LHKLSWLLVSGALGAVSRVGLTSLISWLWPKFPWGTLAVNVLGCFLFGLVWAMTAGPRSLPPELRLIVLGGFMGAFTTFSTYVFDTFRLFQEAGLLAASAYFLANNLIGVGALVLGIALGRTAALGGFL
jgi:CrcB protein